MADIFEIGDMYNWSADYLDPWTGKIYKLKEYKDSLKTDEPLPGIPVFQNGVFQGYVKKKGE